MKFPVILAVCAALAASPFAPAQAPGTEPPGSDVGGGASPELSAEQMANDYLNSEGLSNGKNGEDYISIGTSQLRCLPDNPEFDACLEMSFVEAMLDAKKKMAKFLESEISSEIEAASQAGSAMFEEADGGVSIANQAAINAIRSNAAKFEADILAKMKADGKDVESPAAKNEIRNEAFGMAAASLVGTDEMKRKIALIARAEVAGIYAKQCFTSTKGSGDVAVVCRLTPKGVAMVKAILGKGPAPEGTAKQSIAKWARAAGDGKLAFMFGVQARSDDKGNLCLVSFGQASAKVDSSIMIKQAKSRARLYAAASIRQFAGELVTSSELENSSMDTAALSDASTVIATDMAYQEAVKAKADKLKISGISEAHSWELPHPLSGKKTYGVVMYWNLSNSKEANQLRQTLGALEGSKGGDGATKQMPAKSGSNQAATPAPTERKKAGEGVPSDNDDD